MVSGVRSRLADYRAGACDGSHIMAGVHGREDLLPQWCQEKGRLEKERREFQWPLKATALMTGLLNA